MVKIKEKPINVSNTTLSYKARRHRKFDAKQAMRHNFGKTHCMICDKVFTKYHSQARLCSEECKREKELARKRKYREKNREKLRAYDRKYNEENREKKAAYDRKYYQENREKLRATERKYREENREKINAKQRARYHAKKKQEEE